MTAGKTDRRGSSQVKLAGAARSQKTIFRVMKKYEVCLRSTAGRGAIPARAFRSMIRLAMKQEKNVAAAPRCHSEQGAETCDNAMAENFFSIFKTERFYRHEPATFDEARSMIDRYICFYD